MSYQEQGFSSHQFKSITLYFHFTEALGLEQQKVINISFLVKKFVIKSLSTNTNQDNIGNITPILSVRSDLYNNEILFHYPSQIANYSTYLNHSFYPSIPSINSNYKFALLYNKTESAGDPADIDAWVTFTIEFYG